MNPLFGAIDLVGRFQQVLSMCKVQASETVVIVTDPSFLHPMYPPAALLAARNLGATALMLIVQADTVLEDNVVKAAWTHADMVIGMFFLPQGYSWLYTDFLNDVLAVETRVLTVHEPPDVLMRMMPSETVRRRGLIGAKLMQDASEVLIVSEGGTELSFRKDNRKGSYQCGVADLPGRWDHWPSGMVYCAPLEHTAVGTLVVRPGDVLLGSLRHAMSEVRFSFEAGLINAITGGPDARQTDEYLRKSGDEQSLRLAHAGWGLDHRADWRYLGMDSESFYGNVTIALGRNIFDSPQPFCGMGGKNRAPTHFDICLRDTSLYLDGQLIIDRGRFALEALA
jgi:2,5-dihydroxypyridine 5,6-dioxygenase